MSRAYKLFLLPGAALIYLRVALIH